MIDMGKSRETRTDETLEPIGVNDAIQFWQREVYYYEGRAGEQGASATRVVTVAAGSTAVLALIVNTVSAPAGSFGFDIRLLLLVVPVLMVLLWASAVRLINEMRLLRVYVQRAETELKKLTDSQTALNRYTRWADEGLHHDFSYFVMLVWFAAAGILSVAGTFGITVLVVSLTGWHRMGIALAVLTVAVILLVYSFADCVNDEERIKREFGIDTKVIRSAPKWGIVLASVLAGALVIAGPIVAWALIETGGPELQGWVLCCIIVGTALAGVLLGRITRYSAEKSFGQRASKVLLGLALGEGILAVLCSAAAGIASNG